MTCPRGDWNQISSYRIDNLDFTEHTESCKTTGDTYSLMILSRDGGLGEGPHNIVIKHEGPYKEPRGQAPSQLDKIEVLTSNQDPNPAPI